MDNLVQFEEDFNSRTKKLRGGDRLFQTRPIPRSPDGDNKAIISSSRCLHQSSPIAVDPALTLFEATEKETVSPHDL